MGKLSKNSKDIYEYFKKNNPDTKLTKAEFKLILERLMLDISDRIIDGGILKMGNNLGDIKIKKVKRVLKFNKDGKVSNPPIDWKATNELKKKGINRWVFYDQPFYLKWAWVKRYGKCKVPNQSVYSFKATSNSKMNLGNKGKLAKANRENTLLHLKYEE